MDEPLENRIESKERYDESREDTLRGMIATFYQMKFCSAIILAWSYAIVFIALAIFCGIRFFRTDSVRYMIMYAAIFVCLIVGIALIKVWAWQLIHRHSIKGEIKRLEVRIEELTKSPGREQERKGD